MNKHLRVGILIPAYNEVDRIGGLVKKIKAQGLTPTVIDDGSTDATASEAESNGAKVIRSKENVGKGAALRIGFRQMLNEGYDAVLVMDGDGQHSPSEINKFIEAGSKYDNAMVIGNRMGNTRKMPLDRKLTNMFMSFVVSLICGHKIPDSQCGFRLINSKVLKKIDITCSRFEVESEVLVKACQAGAKITFIPIETLYGEETSRINPFWDTCRFFSFLARLLFAK